MMSPSLQRMCAKAGVRFAFQLADPSLTFDAYIAETRRHHPGDWDRDASFLEAQRRDESGWHDIPARWALVWVPSWK